MPTQEEYIRQVGGNGDYKKIYEDRGIMADRDTLYNEAFLPAYTAYTENFTKIEVFPGVHGTLAVLRKCGIETHIVTAARQDLAMKLIDIIDVRDHCAHFHCHVHNKEAQIHAIIDGMEIHPEECAMMGDLPSDVIHAKQASIKGISFVNPDVPRDLFSTIKPDCTVWSFPDLLKFVL